MEVNVVLPLPIHDALSSQLYLLSERLCKMHPDAQAHGLFGGEYGYGQEFTNDVFEMHPYYWGECTCGWNEDEAAWADAHPHLPECPTNDDDDLTSMCTCVARRAEEVEWYKANPGHRETCMIELPNFRFIATGFEASWYKYIGRGMEANRGLTVEQLLAMFGACHASIAELSDSP